MTPGQQNRCGECGAFGSVYQGDEPTDFDSSGV